jgi:hypothetical protein
MVVNGSTVRGASVGVAYTVPTNDPFYASHSVGIGLAGTTLQTTFVITDSTSAFPFRNDYSIGLFNAGGTRLFSLDMKAVAGSVPGGSNNQWNTHWSTGATQSSAFGGVLENGDYNLSVTFTPSGSNVNFALSLTGTNTFNVNGTLTGLSAQQIASYRVYTTKGTGVTEWGDGFISFVNVKVPEPSVAALLGLGALGLMRRRRA